MLTKQQMNILDIFRQSPNAKYTFKQIKKFSRQKSNNVMQIALHEFKHYNIIATQRVGNVIQYYLNLKNNLTLGYLNILNETKIKKNTKLPKDILDKIQSKLLGYSEFFTLIIFGSYADNKQTKKSDLDIAVIIETDNVKKDIQPLLETVKRREILNIDYHIFSRAEFLEMISAEQENMGKEICRKHIVYYGFVSFYNLIFSGRFSDLLA